MRQSHSEETPVPVTDEPAREFKDQDWMVGRSNAEILAQFSRGDSQRRLTLLKSGPYYAAYWVTKDKKKIVEQVTRFYMNPRDAIHDIVAFTDWTRAKPAYWNTPPESLEVVLDRVIARNTGRGIQLLYNEQCGWHVERPWMNAVFPAIKTKAHPRPLDAVLEFEEALIREKVRP